MVRIFCVICVCLSLSYAGVLLPSQKIELENNIVVMNLAQNQLLVGTDFGEVLEIDLKEKTPKLLVKIPQIKSFYSDSYAPKVYGVDKMGDRILILSEGDYGGKNLYLLENGVLQHLNNVEFPSVKKVAFVDTNKIFLGLSSNEILLFQLDTQKISYRKQLSEAPFSDFMLDLEAKRYVVSCESGILYYGDIQSGDVLKELEGANKDNVYQVRMRHFQGNGYFITAGQDRHVGVYVLALKTNQDSFYVLPTDFLVYSVGLNQVGGLIGAYMENEQSDIRIFDLVSKESLAVLSGHRSVLNNLIFLDSSHLVSSEDGKNILIWEW